MKRWALSQQQRVIKKQLITAKPNGSNEKNDKIKKSPKYVALVYNFERELKISFFLTLGSDKKS